MSSGSSLSPSGWIQTANRFTSTATWAAYSSALAALTLNQMNGSPSTSPTQPPDSPPYDYFSYGVKRTHSGGVKRSKSFTIDAILGLRRDVAPPTDEITSPSSSTTCFNFTGNRFVLFVSLSSSSSLLLLMLLVSTSFGHRCSFPHWWNAEKKSEAETPAAPVASPGGASSPRAKRVRTIFSAEQLERLEAEFARQQYMVGPERLILAASLRLSESQVRYHLNSGPFQSINLQLITVDHFNSLFQTELIRNQLRLQLNSIVFFVFFFENVRSRCGSRTGGSSGGSSTWRPSKCDLCRGGSKSTASLWQPVKTTNQNHSPIDPS